MPYWRLFYHIVWGTKNRLELIDPAWEKDLYDYLQGKATALECIPHGIGGLSQHTHVAISIPPKLCVATIIGQLKGASSHYINGKHTGGSSVAGRIWRHKFFGKVLACHCRLCQSSEKASCE